MHQGFPFTFKHVPKKQIQQAKRVNILSNLQPKNLEMISHKNDKTKMNLGHTQMSL